MKSLLLPVFMSCAILFSFFSCATVPKEPLASGEMRLLSLEVPEKEDLRESLPFMVHISFEADDNPEIVTACFFWSGTGPSCSKVTYLNYGTPGTIKVQLLPKSTGLIALEGYIVYKKDGKTFSTNVVGTNIRIIRPSL